MKSSLIILVALFSMLVISCKRDITIQPNPKRDHPFSKIALPKDASPALRKYFEAMKGYNHDMEITFQSVHGLYKETRYFLTGSTSSDLHFQIDGDPYESRTNGQWWYQDLNLSKYYGKITSFKLNEKEIKIYVPKIFTAKKLTGFQTIKIKRTGNLMEWEKDLNSVTGKLLFNYLLFNKHDSAFYQKTLLIDDNGLYSIDKLIADKNTAKIFIQFIAMNGASAVIDGKKTFLNIGTIDTHEYIIVDNDN
jgi:hypothetical protein